MKSINVSLFGSSSALGCIVAFCGLLMLASSTSLADRGRGSIRAAARPAPAARAAPARVEPARVQPEVRHDQPEAHREVRQEAPAHIEAPAHRDWDENDEDAGHFGGFARGVAAHVLRGARVHDLPPRHFPIDFHNQHYFFDDTGAYYLAQPDGQYLVVQPPVGVVVAALPAGSTPIAFGPNTFYYLDGVFYVAEGNGFAVVNPPPGIVVPVLPSGANQVVVNGTVVYQFEGFNYTPSLQDGVTAYTVTPA